jgi:hypothetical protein
MVLSRVRYMNRGFGVLDRQLFRLFRLNVRPVGKTPISADNHAVFSINRATSRNFSAHLLAFGYHRSISRDKRLFRSPLTEPRVLPGKCQESRSREPGASCF